MNRSRVSLSATIVALAVLIAFTLPPRTAMADGAASPTVSSVRRTSVAVAGPA
jgi:hypothetical protein